MSARERWDAIVVGGGPAGAAVAIRLARPGHRVLLLDRDRFPRAKPCGECLSPGAVAALDALGVLDAVLELPHTVLRGWRVRPYAAPAFEGEFPDARPGIAVRRDRLDSVLLDAARAAGAVVREGVHVTDLVRTDGRVTGVCTGRGRGDREAATIVVGADGLRSIVVRRLGLIRRPPRLRKVALTAHLTDIGNGDDDADGFGELHLGEHGCVGIAHVEEGVANVTVVVAGAAAGAMAGDAPAFFDRAVARVARLRHATRIDPVRATGPFDWPVRAAVADGAVLVGDAAGYYDPFTGQGIYRALEGARLAAAVVAGALAHDDGSAARLRRYEELRRQAFSAGERVQRMIEAATASPALMRVLSPRLRRHRELGTALVGVTGDVLPASVLLRPRNLLRLAW